MAISYAVLYGQRGIKDGFRSKQRALAFAKKKANKTKKSVDLDRITTYPRAKAGQTDWSQTTIKTIKPDRKKKKSR